jgi:hypothetical protein
MILPMKGEVGTNLDSGWDPFKDLVIAMCLQETGRHIHLHNRFIKGVQEFTRANK